MIVAGSFIFSSAAASLSSDPTSRAAMALDQERPKSTPPFRTLTASKTVGSIADKPLTASMPVSIPTRSTYKQPRTAPPAQTVRAEGRNGYSKHRRPADGHNPTAIPPAVAALLAITAIPQPKRKQDRSRKPSSSRRISIDELVQEWREEASTSPSLSAKSPLGILLEIGHDDDEKVDTEDIPVLDLDSEKDPEFLASQPSSRSVSSTSITSTPSLDTANSTVSTWDSPPAPPLRSRRSADKKEKVLVSPPTRECLDDHPLRTQAEVETEYWSPKPASPSPHSPKQKSKSFKSNLTASFQALKSAAKSLSNFAAPSIPSDDLLTRSLLGSRFASEMRPNFHGVPDPALRRYLNPTATHPFAASCPDFASQLQDALISPLPQQQNEGPLPPMIQMHTYKRVSKRSRSAPPQHSSNLIPPDRAEAAVLSATGSIATRQREPRENSDFLRVIVLEMNMRRTGKLDARAGGRARIWLPPRKTASVDCGALKDGVPVRWVATTCETDD